MFNVFGVIWVLSVFEPFLSVVNWIISDVMHISDAGGVAVSFKLSAFHTCFNVCNVLILIWLRIIIEKTVLPDCSAEGTGRRVSSPVFY